MNFAKSIGSLCPSNGSCFYGLVLRSRCTCLKLHLAEKLQKLLHGQYFSSHDMRTDINVCSYHGGGLTKCNRGVNELELNRPVKRKYGVGELKLRIG